MESKVWGYCRCSTNELKQDVQYQIDALKTNYLSFIVSEKIDYHLNMIKQGTKEQKKDANYSVNLRNLLDSIYLYKNNKVQSDTYLY